MLKRLKLLKFQKPKTFFGLKFQSLITINKKKCQKSSYFLSGKPIKNDVGLKNGGGEGGFGGSREFKSEVKEFKIAKAISFKYIFSRVTHKK